MTHAFKICLSWPNNKHYPVMYSVLFSQCWQCETCERTQGAAAAVCGRRHLGCYINFNYFPWQKFVWGHLLLNFSSFVSSPSGQGGVVFCDLGDCFHHILIISYRPNVIFSYTCFSKLLYCIPAYLISLLLDYHQYILCFSSNPAHGDVYTIMW